MSLGPEGYSHNPNPDYGKIFDNTNLKSDKVYSFTGKAVGSSSQSLLAQPKRIYANAKYVGEEGEYLHFKFNGQELYVDPKEVNGFKYEGMTAHGRKKRRTMRRRKNIKKSRRRY